MKQDKIVNIVRMHCVPVLALRALCGEGGGVYYVGQEKVLKQLSPTPANGTMY